MKLIQIFIAVNHFTIIFTPCSIHYLVVGVAWKHSHHHIIGVHIQALFDWNFRILVHK